MNTSNLKTAVLAGAVFALSGLGLSACNKGTEPGETNVERSDIRYPEEDIEQSRNSRDTADYEHHYDHADHREHGNNEPGTVINGVEEGNNKKEHPREQ